MAIRLVVCMYAIKKADDNAPILRMAMVAYLGV